MSDCIALEAPEPGTVCEYCHQPMELVGFCGACERETKGEDMAGIFDKFLSDVVTDCVNGSSGDWPKNAPGPGSVLAAHYRARDWRDVNTPASEQDYGGLDFSKGICIHCHAYARLDDDGWCASCDRHDPAYYAELQKRWANPTVEQLRYWAEGLGQVLCLSLHDDTMPEGAIYKAARQAGSYALDVLGRDDSEEKAS